MWPLLADDVGAEVWVKHENHTPTGAFKVRGGLVYTERLRAGRPGVKGIVSATRGNHGQSLAFAGRAAGIDVTIVVPEGNSPGKLAGLLAERSRAAGRRVAVIHTGGNADAGLLLQVLAGHTPTV